MKKIISCLLVCFLVVSFGACFAAEEVHMHDGEVVTEPHTHDESGEVVYLENYEQYEDLLNSMDEQSEYKEMYNQMIKELKMQFDESMRDEVVRAKVIEASEPEVYYGYYQYMYKSTYQVLKIQILEGQYKGKIIEEVNYVLTADTYENIKLAKVAEGAVINVIVVDDGEGNIMAYSSSVDSPVERWGWVVALLIVMLVAIFIYVGVPGAKMVVPIVLLVDLLVFVMVPLIMEGVNLILLASIIILLSAIVISVLKLGINAKSFTAILATAIIIFVMLVLNYAFDAASSMVGITYEVSGIMESVLPEVIEDANGKIVEIKNVVDFHSLNIGFVMIMVLYAIIPVICKTVGTYFENKEKKDSYKFVVEEMKEYVSDKIITIVGILFTIAIPKYLLLYINKCSLIEIINSEVLINDIVRIIFIVIAMTISVPVTTILGKTLLDDNDSNQEKSSDKSK